MKNNLATIDLKEIANKRVILRVDFNVPVKNGKVQDDFKIERALPTIDFLLKYKCKIVLLSHFGRPEGKRIKDLSLLPVVKELKKKLKKIKIDFLTEKVGHQLLKKINESFKKNDLVVLENIRFEKGEDENDSQLAIRLAKLGDVFVNEAFATAHRKNASTVGLAKLLPSYAGFNFASEVKFLTKALRPTKPAVALVGGSKVETKFQIIKNFSKIYNQVLLGGGLANTFLVARGYDVGGSLFEKEAIRKAKALLKSKKIILPIDVVVTDKVLRKNVRVVRVGKEKKLCLQSEQILDIGPETIKLFSKYIRSAKTIVWGGPVGLLEDHRFAHATLALAKLIGSRGIHKAMVIAGGGETLLAIHLSKMGIYYDFISTGGSAMLKLLEGEKLPGIISLNK